MWNTIHHFLKRTKLSKIGLKGMARSGKMSWRRWHLNLALKDRISVDRDYGRGIINKRKILSYIPEEKKVECV